jgi:hypothetical protein
MAMLHTRLVITLSRSLVKLLISTSADGAGGLTLGRDQPPLRGPRPAKPPGSAGIITHFQTPFQELTEH